MNKNLLKKQNLSGHIHLSAVVGVLFKAGLGKLIPECLEFPYRHFNRHVNLDLTD